MFVPLAGDPFDWFRSGKKNWELRHYGRQFTEEHLIPNRRVELRRGYGDAHVLWGRIREIVRAENARDFFEKVSFTQVIPTAHSVEEAVEITDRILGAKDDKTLIGFQIEMEPTTIPIAKTFVDGVRSGRKTTTIRRGVRRYTLGAAKLVCSEEEIPVDIREVRYTLLKWLTDADARADGYATLSELASALESFYPGIKPDEEVTVVGFHLE